MYKFESLACKHAAQYIYLLYIKPKIANERSCQRQMLCHFVDDLTIAFHLFAWSSIQPSALNLTSWRSVIEVSLLVL